MAVAIVMDFEGGTLDQYDRIRDLMHLEPGGDAPPGALFHWVAETDGGIRVTDVWVTREQFDAFAAEQIGPYSQQVGMPGPPQIEFFDVHNYMAEA